MSDFYIENLINNFSIQNLEILFRKKLPRFSPIQDDYDYLFEDDDKISENYEDIQKIGEAEFENAEDLIVITAFSQKNITNKTGKKLQYEIAKKILKEDNKDAAFFIFYDDEGNFRFSFVRTNYVGSKRDFTSFKRYTYYVSHSLTNQTFKRRIQESSFTTLDDIQEAFSVEPLNKEFYQNISEAFYKLIGAELPNGEIIDSVLNLPGYNVDTARKIYQEFAVRLIGRTIFVWFLKNKKSETNVPLIPNEWLSSKKVQTTNDYYHEILEKLFFEILNKPQSYHQ
jgi:hypothetical protein